MFQSVLFEKFAFIIGQGYEMRKLFDPDRSSPGLLGPQKSCMIRREVGSMRLCGMVLFPNGCRVAVLVATLSTVVVGSKIVRRVPVRVSDCEKFPDRSRSVGMMRTASRGCFVRQPS